MAPRVVTIGTRGSRLALAQSEWVRARLLDVYPELRIDLQIIKTKGDLILDRALSRIGDKGLFVAEIESALLERRVDLAVHSCKDLPSEVTVGLTLAAFPRRADPRDVLVSRDGVALADLPRGARIGTSSLRRASQLHAYRADFDIVNLRGNVDTRLRKAETDDYDAIVLAAAGLARLELSHVVTEFLDPAVMLPAVAQGALALECRAEDELLRDMLAALDHPPTRAAVSAERAFLRHIQGGCQLPVAAFAVPAGPTGAQAPLYLQGLIGAADGSQIIRDGIRGDEPEAIGIALADELLRRGADRILERLAPAIPAVAQQQSHESP